jgi:putative NADH-flavin reductase
MKIAIIGASAGVGLETTRRALAQGHEVTTLSRRLEPLPDHAQIKKVQGSSTSVKDVTAALEGAEAVLVTLGTGNSTKATTLYSDSARVLVQAHRDLGSDAPIIVVTGFGAGASWDYNVFLMKLLFTLVLKTVYTNKTEMEKLIAASGAHWVIVRPGRLNDGPMTGRYRVLDALTREMKVGAISRADVAHFLVAQAEHPTYLGKYLTLTT